MYEHLQDKTDHIFLLHGGRSEKESTLIRQQMKAVPEDESIVLVATGQYIGEGFNYPRLDTMMLTMPVAWQGNVEQYSGRLHRDHEAKNREIVISSPGLNVPKVKAFIKQVKAVQENGVQIVVFTLSPECYPASRTEITRKLVRKLEQAGIRVLLQEALHEHYAVIDHEIVWYGSMNFLSAEKEEDNLMRVVSGEIAEELLGGSVGFSIRE